MCCAALGHRRPKSPSTPWDSRQGSGSELKPDKLVTLGSENCHLSGLRCLKCCKPVYNGKQWLCFWAIFSYLRPFLSLVLWCWRFYCSSYCSANFTLLYICSLPFHSKPYVGISEHLLLFDNDTTFLLTASLPNIGVNFTQIWYFVCRFNWVASAPVNLVPVSRKASKAVVKPHLTQNRVSATPQGGHKLPHCDI